MGAQVALKKPLCIESHIVYKIDRIVGEKTETLYSCAQFKKVSFSKFLYEKLDLIEGRLRKVEMILPESMRRSDLVLQFEDSSQPADDQASVAVSAIQILSDKIVLTSEALQTEALEKAVLQWSLKKQFKNVDHLYLETLVDFMATSYGAKGYRSLISEAWNTSFADQSFLERRQLMRAISQQMVLSYDAEISAVQNLQKLLQHVAPQSAWELSFGQELARRGYLNKEALAQLRLDLIVDVSGTDEAKKIATQLVQLSREGLKKKIAIKTSAGLLLLPSLLPLPNSSDVFSSYHLVFSDSHTAINARTLNHYTENSERLVFVDVDSDISTASFRSLLTRGVPEFLANNRQLNFVQIHLPSYKLKSAELKGLSDYFAFVKQQESFSAEKKVLGWQQSEWNKDLQAFKPIAYFDVIQYFRIN
ncbi:hypothetical protein A11Q_2268 [Pseudobdellovibrio exovorus JSS]|uniref:Uncharacterized protein n=2 Tax=Pseudobdellovibrio exovorus TaxID=453816 RepID=M4VTH4_9BACT|nr:hypothetical protein A11Q_2268 [Pseudobdellovibrio exovorus JSS]